MGKLTHVDTTTVQGVVQRYVEQWNADHADVPLWVVLAGAGDAIAIPGVTFARAGEQLAGMHHSIRAELIVLNRAMVPSSLLSTFLHEFGHMVYRASSGNAWNEVASEAAAVRFSLEALEVEGFPDLAAREATAVLGMSGEEAYRGAVELLKHEPVWQRYANAK
jgi:hypothetical protein